MLSLCEHHFLLLYNKHHTLSLYWHISLLLQYTYVGFSSAAIERIRVNVFVSKMRKRALNMNAMHYCNDNAQLCLFYSTIIGYMNEN